MNAQLKSFLYWILDRLSEQSTWKGIMGVATAAGVMLKPDQWDKIIAFGFASTALINICRNEKKTTAVAADAAVQRALNPAVPPIKTP